jgi:hypothetical protein
MEASDFNDVASVVVSRGGFNYEGRGHNIYDRLKNEEHACTLLLCRLPSDIVSLLKEFFWGAESVQCVVRCRPRLSHEQQPEARAQPETGVDASPKTSPLR